MSFPVRAMLKPIELLGSAPHRVYFLAGAIQAVLTILWWLCSLIGIFPAARWVVASVWVHAFLMMYGFFPFLIFGFLMTAAPNWVKGKKVDRTRYLPAFLFMAAGIFMFYPSLLIGRIALAICVSLYLAGWLTSGLALLNIVTASDAKDKIHAYTVIINLLVGWLGCVSYLCWLLTGDAIWLHGSLTTGIWLFLLPIFLSVSHRMIPFFSGAVLQNYALRRPNAPLFALLAGMAAHAILKLAGYPSYLWIVDIPMAIVAFQLSWLWEIGRSLEVRLLAMLHIAFSWLGIALTLYALQSLVLFISHDALLGRAPLHALTIGYFSSMAIAMVTRVTLGHSGRPLVADKTVWLLFLGFQFSAVFRIMGDLPIAAASDCYIAAAIVWLICFSAWGIRHVPMYWKPRVDGRKG